MNRNLTEKEYEEIVKTQIEHYRMLGYSEEVIDTMQLMQTAIIAMLTKMGISSGAIYNKYMADTLESLASIIRIIVERKEKK